MLFPYVTTRGHHNAQRIITVKVCLELAGKDFWVLFSTKYSNSVNPHFTQKLLFLALTTFCEHRRSFLCTHTNPFPVVICTAASGSRQSRCLQIHNNGKTPVLPWLPKTSPKGCGVHFSSCRIEYITNLESKGDLNIVFSVIISFPVSISF